MHREGLPALALLACLAAALLALGCQTGKAAGKESAPSAASPSGQTPETARLAATAVEEIAGASLEERFKLQGVRQYFVKNQQAGSLLVLEGRVLNAGKEAVDLIKIEATLMDKAGKVLSSKKALAGVTVALSQLETFPEADLEALLNDEAGILMSNLNVGNGDAVPFMVIFYKPPQGVSEYGIKVVEALPAEAVNG